AVTPRHDRDRRAGCPSTTRRNRMTGASPGLDLLVRRLRAPPGLAAEGLSRLSLGVLAPLLVLRGQRRKARAFGREPPAADEVDDVLAFGGMHRNDTLGGL